MEVGWLLVRKVCGNGRFCESTLPMLLFTINVDMHWQWMSRFDAAYDVGKAEGRLRGCFEGAVPRNQRTWPSAGSVKEYERVALAKLDKAKGIARDFKGHRWR